MKRSLSGALAACILAAGCASGPETNAESATAVRGEPEYTTGSNLPRRAGSSRSDVRVLSPEALDTMPGSKGSGAGN